jgi:hypothetical protein
MIHHVEKKMIYNKALKIEISFFYNLPTKKKSVRYRKHT